MDRRAFTTLAVALGLTPSLGELAHAQQTTSGPRTRRNVSSLAAASDIAAYRKGVAALKKNTNATEYDSWMYWANSHGTPEVVPMAMQKVWYQCEHGTTHFLTWHRGYLYFFEALIREKSGEDGFALPYWSWYASKDMPADFGAQDIDGRPNVLFHAPRTFRDRTLVTTALTRSDFYDFGSMLEGNPHGTVHTMVGGDMGAVETSARDPIFWLHHCNIDRMWSTWLDQDAKRKNPTDPTWQRRKFAFDLAGMKSKQVNDLLDTAGSLSYAYDSLKPVGNITDPVPLRPQNTIEVPLAQGAFGLGSQPLGKPLNVARKLPLPLRGGSVALDFSVPGGASPRMETMASPAATTSPSLTLVLKDVKVTLAGIQRGADYRVYLNLPRERKDTYRHEDFYLGSINTFALSHHNGAHPKTFTFDLSALAFALNRHGLWSHSKVSISLLSDDEESSQPLVQVGDVQLLISDKPLK